MAEHKPTVERDANGVPTAWLLVRAGPVPLRKNGADYVLELTSKDLSAIEAYQKTQGESIPIDSNHFLHILAQAHGVEETEALKIIPSGVVAMGFGSLECRADGQELWINAEWTPSAYELLKEKIFRYFSPVFRGLKDGPIRITSVAMENEPAIKNLASLAAGAEDKSPIDDAACGAYLELETTKPNTKGRAMNMTPKLRDALQRLAPGIDTAALAAEDADVSVDGLLDDLKRLLALEKMNSAGNTEIKAVVEALLEKLKGKPPADETSSYADETKQDELAAAVDSAAGLLEDLRKLLELAEAAGNAEIKAAVEAMLEKAKQGEAAKAEADELKLSAEKRERAEIYAKAEAERKLTPAMKPWADSLDIAALAAWYKVAPVAVPGELPKTPPETPEAVPLSAEDEKAIASLGLDREAYIEAKKTKFGLNQEGN